MYQYLSEKIEEHHEFNVANLLFVPMALWTENPEWITDMINQTDTSKILETVSFKTDMETVEYFDAEIEDISFAQFLSRHRSNGFFAEVRYPEHFKFSEKNGKPTSFQFSWGVQNIQYLYAHSITELFEKIITKGEELHMEQFQKEKLSKA